MTPAVLTADLAAVLGPPLAAALGGDAALLDCRGRTLWGRPSPGGRRVVLARGHANGILGWVASSTATGAALQGLADAVAVLLCRPIALDDATAGPQFAAEDDQRQVYQAEKLAAVGQLAAGVAHEVNNPLAVLRSNLAALAGYMERIGAFRARLDAAAAGDWRARDLDEVLEDGCDLLRDSRQAVERIGRIVRDLTGYSHVDRPPEAVVDLNDHLRQVAAVIRPTLPPGITLALVLGPLPPLLCLPGHLNQVFRNLIDNAVRATRDRRLALPVEVVSRAVPGGIEVTVRDAGVGMEPPLLRRAFDPFFTTRPVGEGSGLGLTVARDIVLAHDGDITLKSVPGQGSLATVFLPT